MSRLKGKNVAIFVFVFLISCVACFSITSIYISNSRDLEKSQMEQQVQNKANKVSNVLMSLLYKTEILSAFVQQSNGNVEDFNQIAATIIDDPSIKNILLAKDGIVSQVYPLKGNEKVLGMDFFSDRYGNKEAILARKRGKLVLGGPFKLVQGGQALVGRLPIYIEKNGEKKFWGIASVTLNYPQALAGAELDMLRNQGYAFEIWRISPDTNKRQIIANSDYKYNDRAIYVEELINILGAKWNFRLSSIKSWYEEPATWAMIIISLIISVLMGCLTVHNYELRNMKRKLERISFDDPLTGIFNRRKLLQVLEDLVKEKESPFVLSYIDIDDFKVINDKYGHAAGDTVLKHFTRCILAVTNPDEHILARVGGDEFIIISKGTADTKEVELRFKEARVLFEEKNLSFCNEKIHIEYSVGRAVFPTDGTTVDSLIAVADERMYASKQKLHNETI